MASSLLASMAWDPFSPAPPGPPPPVGFARSLYQDDDPSLIPSFDPSSAAAPPPPTSTEQELRLLATNFLLYVAMVIITAMVARQYFPHTMDLAGTSPGTSNGTDPAVPAGSAAAPAPRRDADPPSSLDDSSDSDDDPAASFLHPASSPPPSPSRRASFVPTSLNHAAAAAVPVQTEAPGVVFRRLMFCAAGLVGTFVTWGVLQERICAHRYPRETGEFFPYTYFLVFTNRLWSLLFSAALVAKSKDGFRWVEGMLIYEYSFPSISNMLSSWCQYEALKYVTFPAQTLFKSFKIFPVMLMGKFLFGTTYPTYDYAAVLVIGAGISFFMLGSPENVEFDRGIDGDAHAGVSTGVILLSLFLLFDSFTGQFQSRMFTRHSKLTVPELLFATNAFSTVLSLITLVHTDELRPALDFVWKHSEIHLHFFLFSVCSTVGQLLIFYTIKNFGAVIFAIIMVVRVLISIVVSCVMYGHDIDATGLGGLALVMAGVLYRVKMKAGDKQLLLFEGINEGQGKVMVREWREHLEL
ncbi:hypothetical protein TeGR_g5048 [Tetraparma gracilis]|uniref:Uncharacterized protein n=1 Tax=Tetraparma gracilis TaxID=2962635 RepID=A0ABQ6N4V0_9STRA|nr:hypothetical protein TeGR_g5048 [Tetraparma gracilis]